MSTSNPANNAGAHQENMLAVSNLSIDYPSRHGVFQAVKQLSFSLAAGEILGLVGESGAGKSTVGNAIAELLTPPGYISSGQISLAGKSLIGIDKEQMRQIRGKDIGFIFQDPMTSLNPLFTIENQMVEALTTNLDLSPNEAKERAIQWLDAVGIPNPRLRIKQYPHQFSGGMRQRVVIAIALSTEPKIIIADEPTTALDVSIQDQILTLIKKLCKENDVGCILVTHDMGVISTVSDRVAVMYKGGLVEIGDTQQVLGSPQHDYSKSLISAVPRADIKLKRFPALSYIESANDRATFDVKTHWLGQHMAKPDYQGPILSVRDISLKFLTQSALLKKNRLYIEAIKHISFDIAEGETFGLVGESGSGKSTIARAITGLYPPNSGDIIFEGQSLTAITNERARLPIRRQMQMVFQNPYSSLNPRMKVASIIAEPIRFYRLAHSEKEITDIVKDLIDYVGLGKEALDKYPHEFSGGQRQRISIARALATRPRLLLCDEPTSALDVSVQAQILNLLKDLQQELRLTMLFISHDLPVIRQMCDRIGVMRQGRLVEVSETDYLFGNASHEYTRELISLMPSFTANIH